MFQLILSNRGLIWQLTVHELRSRYAATLIGSVWAVINPVVVIVVFWFVCSYGLRITFESGPPYFLVLFCGLIPWMTFNEALTGAAGAVLQHQYLVKRVSFPLEILPIVNIVSAAVVHFFLVALLMIILLLSGIRITPHSFQAIYFLIAMVSLTIGLSWAFAALQVFHRDLGHALAAILTIWFWITPIVWPVRDLSDRAMWLIQLNPLFYVVQGYRNAFLYEAPLFAMWPLDVYFWGLTVTLLVLGATVFRQLRPHLADVL